MSHSGSEVAPLLKALENILIDWLMSYTLLNVLFMTVVSQYNMNVLSGEQLEICIILSADNTVT